MQTLADLVYAKFDAKLVSNGNELALVCPLCGDHKARLFINLKTYLWTCHHCNRSGMLVRFLEEVMDMDAFEAYRTAAKLQPASARRPKPEKKIESTLSGPLPGVPLTNRRNEVEAQFWNYVDSRGLTDEDVAHYRMQYTIVGPYRGRLIIPIIQQGKIRSFAARTITPWITPKVLYPQGAAVGDLLFGLDDLDHSEVILTEGVFDAIRLRGRAVCTFGTHLSDRQRALLHSEKVKRVMLMWDGDEAGMTAAAKYVKELQSDGFEVKLATLPEGVDPAAASEEDLTNAIASATMPALLSSQLSLRRRS